MIYGTPVSKLEFYYSILDKYFKKAKSYLVTFAKISKKII